MGGPGEEVARPSRARSRSRWGWRVPGPSGVEGKHSASDFKRKPLERLTSLVHFDPGFGEGPEKDMVDGFPIFLVITS